MASSLLVSRLANEISSILICTRPWRGRLDYSQLHGRQHVGLGRPRLGLQACQGRVFSREGGGVPVAAAGQLQQPAATAPEPQVSPFLLASPRIWDFQLGLAPDSPPPNGLGVSLRYPGVFRLLVRV